jgi:uncharacterized protein (DUF697 family)
MSAVMSPAVVKLVRRTSIGTGVLGVILSPIPLADELLLLPVYAVLSARIGKDHGLSVRAIPWRPIGATAVAGLAARAAVNVTVSYIPGVAAVANAATAVALTQFFGRYVDEACAHPETARSLGVQDVIESIRPRKASSDGAGGAPSGAT